MDIGIGSRSSAPDLDLIYLPVIEMILAGKHRIHSIDSRDVCHILCSYDDGISFRIDINHIKRFPVCDPQPLSLPYRIVPIAIMAANNLPIGKDYAARAVRDSKKVGVITTIEILAFSHPILMEIHLHIDSPDLFLCIIAKREDHRGKLLLGKP